MIHTSRIITVGKEESTLNDPIILYRGDRQVEVEFEIIGSDYTYTNGDNIIKTTNATHGQLVLNTPTGNNMFSEVTDCVDGKVIFVITGEMIDELEEVGFYSFQIRLFDETQGSRVTLPPIYKGVDIRNPIASEDHNNLVGLAIVDYAEIQNDNNKELPTFDAFGDYNKTEWKNRDVIASNKLNKVEDALYKIHSKSKENETSFNDELNNINISLKDKANKDHIWSMRNMGQDIKEAMTGGSVAVVGDNSILDSNIIDRQISSSKLASSTIINTVKFNKLNSISGYSSIYIQPFKLKKGVISIKVKSESGDNTIYLLNKVSNDNFKIIESVTLKLEEGVNIIEDIFIVNADNMYIGIKSLNGIYYGADDDGNGFYEIGNIANEEGLLVAYDHTSLNYMLGIEIVCKYSKLLDNVNHNISSLDDRLNEDLNLLFPNKKQQIQDITAVESSNTIVNPTSIYIPNIKIETNGRGVITVNSYGEFAVYIFEKLSDNNFKLKHKQIFYSVGINEHRINYNLKKGYYIGLHGSIKYKNTGGSYGFYEAINKNILDITDIDSVVSFNSDNIKDSSVGYKFIFGFKLDIDLRYINADVIDVSEIDLSTADLTNVDISKANWENVDGSKIKTSNINLTDFNLLKYSEINDEIGFMGRWFDALVEGENCKCTINAGSEFYFKVKGATTVNVNFKINSVRATPFFAYSIDGGEFTRQLITSPTLPTISTDEHIIRIVIDGLTETEDKWNGEKGIALKDITVNEGTIKGLIPRNRKIMFFGDSITEGIRALNMNADSNGNSAIKAYPFECCKKLNAVTYRVGFGATSITNPYGSGGIPNCLKYIDNMTNSRETPYYEPDIIVINHGTNDGNNGSDLFIPAYDKVLDRLTLKYSGIPIFTMIPFNQAHASDIRECVSNRTNCYLVETNNWGVTYTDSLHPDANGAKIAGGKLADEILKVLGKSFFI